MFRLSENIVLIINFKYFRSYVNVGLMSVGFFSEVLMSVGLMSV